MVLGILKVAVTERKKVSITYKGFERLIEPYLTGINHKGNQVLRAYQVGGYSSTGSLPAWRMFFIHEIENIQLLEEAFEINEQYNPYDKAMTKILFRIDVAQNENQNYQCGKL